MRYISLAIIEKYRDFDFGANLGVYHDFDLRVGK